MVFVIVHDRRDTSLAAFWTLLETNCCLAKLMANYGPCNAKLRCAVDVLTLGNWIHRVDAVLGVFDRDTEFLQVCRSSPWIHLHFRCAKWHRWLCSDGRCQDAVVLQFVLSCCISTYLNNGGAADVFRLLGRTWKVCSRVTFLLSKMCLDARLQIH